MWKWLVIVMFVTGACNLQSASAPTRTPEILPSVELPETNIVPLTNQPPTLSTTLQLTPNRTALPTRLPSVGATSLPSPNAQALGQNCAVYVVYSGSDPDNVISLRAQPDTTAPQVLRIPNNARVYLVPGSVEIEADGYHWLNVLYVDAAQNRYQGWAARDSFMEGGVRDTSINTLRATGEQSPC